MRSSGCRVAGGGTGVGIVSGILILVKDLLDLGLDFLHIGGCVLGY